MNDLRCLGAAGSGSTLYSAPAALRFSRSDKSLQRILSELRLLAVLPERTAFVVALALQPPTAAEGSSQPLPW